LGTEEPNIDYIQQKINQIKMKKICVPTDFSKQATNAIDLAVEISQKSVGEIILFHVIEHPISISYSGGSSELMAGGKGLDKDEQVYILKLMEKMKHDLAEVRGKYSKANIQTSVVVGRPYESISEVIEEQKADLIIMGTKGTSGLSEILVGSNAEKVVRNAPCPVITVNEHCEASQIKAIAFATNLASGQDKIIESLIELQKLFEAQLHLVRINTINNFERDKDVLKFMKKFAVDHNLENYTLNTYNDLEEEDGIVSFAEEKGADMIAMATHGRSGVKHLLSGSIAEDVVNHAKRPVWTARMK